MAELDRAAISLRLGQALKESGITQQEMADLLHVHKRSIEDYVSPRVTTVPFDSLDEWGRITGKTKEWLLHGDDGVSVVPNEVVTDLLGEIRSSRTLLETVLERISTLERELQEERARRAEPPVQA